uniref:Coiled-coil domain containing 68 n=1 Tax=Cricetulus griseus TaxID=10029 RepID=A0A8C2MBR9_CRIGR
MTTVTVTTEVSPRGKTEGDSVLYGSSSAHIIEETEYVKKIRTTLEKVRNHMFKDEEEHGNENYLLDAEQSGNFQNGSDLTTDPNSLDFLMENMRRKDQQLLEMNRENEMLKIKLEASREAGAAALRNVAQRLFDNYQTHSEDMKKKQEDGRRLLQINSLEKEQTLKQRAENLSQLSEKLEEKHGQIIGLENRVQRMENNKDLKTKVAHWSETPKTSVSKAVSTSELKTEGASPYLMLIRLRK